MELSVQELDVALWYVVSGLLAAEAQRSTTRHHIDLVIQGISNFDRFLSSTTFFVSLGRYALLAFVAYKIGFLFAVALAAIGFLLTLACAFLVPLLTGGERPIVWKLSGYAMWPALLAAWAAAL